VEQRERFFCDNRSPRGNQVGVIERRKRFYGAALTPIVIDWKVN
jgi:hypothetical protein